MKYLIFLFTIISLPSFGQNASNDSSNVIFTICQQMPEFKGTLNKYLSDEIHYPKVEMDSNITGTVYINFVVEKDGEITGVRVLRGIPRGSGLDKEAVRVVSAMPKWKPGMQNGKPVRVEFNLPIHFQLR